MIDECAYFNRKYITIDDNKSPYQSADIASPTGYYFQGKNSSEKKYDISTENGKKNKKKSALNNKLNERIKKEMILTPMPKFIWVAQFFSPKLLKFNDERTLGMILLDATEASKSYLDALLFIVYPDKWCYRDENGNIIPELMHTEPFELYSNFKKK